MREPIQEGAPEGHGGLRKAAAGRGGRGYQVLSGGAKLIVEKLPEIVRNAAKSLESTPKLIIVRGRAPSQRVGRVVDIAATALALVKALMGMDPSELAGRLKDITK